MTDAIPEGYPRVTPYLIVDGAEAAIDFYGSVLGATERMRMEDRKARSVTPSSRSATRSSCWPTSIRRWTPWARAR